MNKDKLYPIPFSFRVTVGFLECIEKAACWCRQSQETFVKSAIEDKLDEIAPLMEADELE